MKEEKMQWSKARQQANQSGITLTRRKNKQGEYVCYLNKKTMKAYLWGPRGFLILGESGAAPSTSYLNVV